MSTNLTRPSEVKALLREWGFKPRRTWGQNFLIDRNVLNILVQAADLTSDDVVLEVGPGLGVLTEELLPRVGRLVAVEKDPRLFEHLQGRHGNADHLELHHADILSWSAADLAERGVNKIVANLPYAVGTRAIVSFIEGEHPPELITVTVQDDVARRMLAQPRTPEYGVLSVLLQSLYGVGLVKLVKPTCFLPPPQVMSAIVTMRLSGPEHLRPQDPAHFRALVKALFAQRRKQMGTLLRSLSAVLNRTGAAAGEALAALELEPALRPGDLSVDDWRRLSDHLAAGPGDVHQS